MEAVTQVILGHVQAMFDRFTESFEQRLMQEDSEVPRECSRSPLHDPSPGETRVLPTGGLRARHGCESSVGGPALSPGAAQAYRHIMLAEHGDDTLTVHLGATGEAPARQASPVDSHTESSEKSHSRKMKHEKRKKKNRLHCSSSDSMSVQRGM